MGERLGNDEHGVGVGLQAQPGLSLELAEALPDGEVHGDLVGAGPRHHTPEKVLSSAILRSKLSLSHTMLVHLY